MARITGNRDDTDVTVEKVRRYISCKLSDNKPKRLAKDNKLGLSPKSVCNIWITLCSFFGWLNRGFNCLNPKARASVATEAR